MYIEKFLIDPWNSLQYADRYINNGSPSGYTNLNSTSPHTSPSGSAKDFGLFACSAPEDWFFTYGEIPNWPVNNDSQNWLLLHPDMAFHDTLKHADISLTELESLRVVPTASGRTVQFINGLERDYVKLHYDGILGRFSRTLPFKKAVAGPEISKILSLISNNEECAKEFCFLPETGARCMTIPTNSSEWGMIWRSCHPLGKRADNIAFMIPYFSLFSTDRFFTNDRPILLQLISHSKISAEEYCLSRIVLPVIRSYFYVLRNQGIQLELNAQNILIGFDTSLEPIAVIVKDLGGADKDLTLRDSLNLTNDFLSFPYKCISRQQNDYQKRHSFIFDFKLGEYVIEPVLKLVSEAYNLSLSSLQQEIREFVDRQIESLPTDFFPQGTWYSFDRSAFGDKREYSVQESPKFRS